MTVRIAFLQHSEFDLPGLLERRALELGFAAQAYRADRGGTGLPRLDDFDLLVVMGSIESTTNGSLDWLGDERRLIAEAVAADAPVLGVCFGGQLLAQVLGSEVSRAATKEVGWIHVDSSDPDRVPTGPWLAWHEDEFTVPPGADLVARTEVSLHAYVLGIHTGVQFHPEVTPQIVRLWVADALAEDRLTPSEAEDLLSGFDPSGRGHEDRARQLFDGYVDRAGIKT